MASGYPGQEICLTDSLATDSGGRKIQGALPGQILRLLSRISISSIQGAALKIWIFLALFTAPSVSPAQTTVVIDPFALLPQVSAFLNSKNFETSLVCGQSARFFTPVQKVTLACGANGCSAAFETVDTAEGNSEVANCSPEAVSIYADNGQIIDIGKVEFEKQKGNMGRFFLQNLETFLAHPGEVTVESLTPAEYTVASGRKYPALHINGLFRLANETRTFPILVTVVKEIPALAQVARFRIQNQTWFRLKEF
jgi:hypothetical protein